MSQPEQDAKYWKARYEQERERVVKLWVAYKTLEAQVAPEARPPPPADPEEDASAGKA